MNKKKWALLILGMLLIFTWIKLFYKTYNEDVVIKDADSIIILDVKRITNTILWNTITTPSEWRKPDIFSSGNDAINWKDMIKIPDYIMVFHTKNQPLNAWYTVLQVKNEDDFNKGLQQYNFKKLGNNEYINKDYGIHIVKNGNKILLANAAIESENIAEVANDLFARKNYISKEDLTKIIDAKSHLTMYIAANSFLREGATITANFDKRKIEINTSFQSVKQYNFTENNFAYSSSSLCAIGFTQPPPAIYNLLDSNSSNTNDTSKMLSMNVDSLLSWQNKWYSLDIAGIKPRLDSAISYTYDDDFNKVENVVINNVQEPAFNFTIAGDNTNNIYNYWQQNNKLEKTNAGELFVPIPFVKSYCNKKENQLDITSDNYQFTKPDKNITCIFFLSISFTKASAIFNYLPNNILNLISNIESLHMVAKKDKEKLLLNCVFNKKKNDLPIIRL